MPKPPPLSICLGLLATAIGCTDKVRFAPDELLRATEVLNAEQQAAVDETLLSWFGTPDTPKLPEEIALLSDRIDPEALAQAAGPVESHTPGLTHGLYRRHCARCHGVTGDGRGPTALYQDPYPRDFRRGVFKWKSTRCDAPPTAADLHAVLERGVPGTAMPSFALLPLEEREQLTQYVQYLVLRGAAERELVAFTAEELPPGEALDLENEAMRQELLDRLESVAAAWVNASEAVLDPPKTDALTESLDARVAVAKGKRLFHSESAGCAKCHGKAGQGGARPGVDYEIDYDLWSRPRVDARASLVGLPVAEREAVSAALALQLPARVSRPRGLVGEALRGGDSPMDLFRRLHQGVAGSPMPALGPRRPGEKGALTDGEIVLITEYLETLVPARTTAVIEPIAEVTR